MEGQMGGKEGWRREAHGELSVQSKCRLAVSYTYMCI